MSEFPFSSKTLGLLAEAIEQGNSASTMRALFLKSEVDAWEPESSSNKLDLATKVVRRLRSDGSTEASAGALELTRAMLESGRPRSRGFGNDGPADWWPALRDAAAADGWEFDENDCRLVPTVPGTSVAVEASWIENTLTSRGWDVAAGHYRQAIEAFASGNWASTNSQLRAFFEDLMRRAGGISPGGGAGQVQRAFDTLEAGGHLVDGEQQFGKDLWKLLHANGSHPGLSDADESRFRLLTLTGYARYLLTRV